MTRRRQTHVLNSQGFPITQHEYNALMRSVANLSALVVHLEDKLDALREQAAINSACSRAPGSGETLPDTPG